MATSYTVVSNNNEKNRAQVVIEYDVPPSGTNAAGVAWRTIVSEVRSHRDTTGTSNPHKQSDTGYLNKLDSGAKLEVPFTVTYNAGMTNAQKAAEIDAQVAAKVADYTNDFQAVYEFYGTERTV